MNEFILSSEILTEFELETPKEYKVNAIILLVENNRLKDGYNLFLFNKEMKNWVRDSVSHFDCKFVNYKDKENAAEVIKPFVEDEDYTVVLFSDTPLINSSTVLEVLDYATTKQLDFCKLPRGFIVKTNSLLNNQISLSAEPTFIEKDEFFTVFDYKTLAVAKTKLKEKIIEKHLKNKVIINDINSVYIDSTVEISSLVEIGANNVLKGNTIINSGCVLKENNIIENSIIGENCEIVSSIISNEKIENGTKIGPFATILGLSETNDGNGEE